MISTYDIDDAIMILDDMISGAEKDRGRDARLSEVIRLLEQLKVQDTGKARDAPPPEVDSGEIEPYRYSSMKAPPSNSI